jgi:cyclopropane fatty-acyl-phospholipid synthase-like methyltransferase
MKRADWDRLADDFETETCDITREESADLTERFVSLARIPKRKAVLIDLGCGVGTFIHRFGGRFGEIFGVEFAPRIIARARKRCADMANVTWLNNDIPHAARKIGTKADLTVCLNVITSDSMAKRAALWSSVASVTKKGGFALVVVPSLESEDVVAAEMKTPPKRKSGGVVKRDDAWQKHYERGELETLFGKLGFTVKCIEPAHYPWSIEGLRETKARAVNRPWDWMCLARRV